MFLQKAIREGSGPALFPWLEDGLLPVSLHIAFILCLPCPNFLFLFLISARVIWIRGRNGRNCVPANSCVEALILNVTVFGHRAPRREFRLNEVIRMNLIYRTGGFIRRERDNSLHKHIARKGHVKT